jgi:hypothetical protein
MQKISKTETDRSKRIEMESLPAAEAQISQIITEISRKKWESQVLLRRNSFV